MREDRPFLELKLAAATRHFHDDVRAENVGGHEVGRELNAIEGKIEHFTQRANEQSFTEAGNAFEEHMPAGEQRDQRAINDRFMANNRLGNFPS
jgi:hypothetical protein